MSNKALVRTGTAQELTEWMKTWPLTLTLIEYLQCLAHRQRERSI